MRPWRSIDLAYVRDRAVDACLAFDAIGGSRWEHAERLGWTLHLHGIRSVEKLTAAGMTFLDSDVIRVLEEVLPGRFGGGPTHYQLVEEEDAEDGRASGFSSTRRWGRSHPVPWPRSSCRPSSRARGPKRSWVSRGATAVCFGSSGGLRSPRPPGRSFTSTPAERRPRDGPRGGARGPAA